MNECVVILLYFFLLQALLLDDNNSYQEGKKDFVNFFVSLFFAYESVLSGHQLNAQTTKSLIFCTLFVNDWKMFSIKNCELKFSKIHWIWVHEKIRKNKLHKPFFEVVSQKNSWNRVMLFAIKLVSRKIRENKLKLFLKLFSQKNSWNRVMLLTYYHVVGFT